MLDERSKNFLQYVYNIFQSEGRWPQTRRLRAALWDEGNPERLAAEIGQEYIIWPSSQIGAECYLRLRGFSECEGSETDVEHFIMAMRYVAQQVIASEEAEYNFSTSDLIRDLGFSEDEARRVTDLFAHDGRIWSSGLGPDQNRHRSFQIRGDQAFYFRDIHNLDDYWNALVRMEEDAQYIAGKRHRHVGIDALIDQIGEDPAGHGIRLEYASLSSDPRLRVMLESDLRELNSSIKHGLWKSAAILAGSCCEAVLLDLWMRDEEAARREFGSGWPHAVALNDLLRASVRAGLLHGDSSEFINIVRRWRNLVHPAKALQSSTPRREVAIALMAVLGLLFSELAASK